MKVFLPALALSVQLDSQCIFKTFFSEIFSEPEATRSNKTTEFLLLLCTVQE